MSWLQTEYALEKCLIGRNELEGKVIPERTLIEHFVKLWMHKEGLDLRTKEKSPVHLCVVKGFDAEHVPGCKELLILNIPNDECVHTPQAVQETGTPLLVSVEQSLGVRVGGESVPCGKKLSS